MTSINQSIRRENIAVSFETNTTLYLFISVVTILYTYLFSGLKSNHTVSHKLRSLFESISMATSETN